MGYHKYDCENIYVLYKYNDYINKIIKPEHVYFSQHGSKQGQWVRWEDCDTYYNNKPTLNLYVARGSHAFYPKPKVTYRIFCFGNDNTIRDDKYLKIVDTFYDAVNFTNPIRMSIVIKQVSEYSMNLFERFLIPFTI